VRQLIFIANVALSPQIHLALMMEAILSSETSVLTGRNIPEDGIPHGHRRANLKFYIAITGWAL
jgi:hypothetical protein